MILHPGILSLTINSLLTLATVLYAGWFGVGILRRWDLASGSELQLALERRTYLISTVVTYFLFFQLTSLFLFVRTADSICDLFVGAMCAVGTLTVNSFGFPTLFLKLLNFILAGLWLIVNHADSKGYDYPLIRVKYLFLIVLAPLILTETLLQTLFFLRLTPDIITSCCGSLFSPASRGVVNEIVNAPPLPTLALFYGVASITLVTGLRVLRTGRGGGLFGAVTLLFFLVSLVALISVISLYIYRMPSHHCPLCILDPEYDYIGYPIYLSLFASTVAGLGVGVLSRYRGVESLFEALPLLTRRLAAMAVGGQIVFLLLCSGPVLLGSFTLRPA